MWDISQESLQFAQSRYQKQVMNKILTDTHLSIRFISDIEDMAAFFKSFLFPTVKASDDEEIVCPQATLRVSSVLQLKVMLNVRR